MSSLALETATNAEKLGIRTALGVGPADTPTLRGLSLVRDESASLDAVVGSSGGVNWTSLGTAPFHVFSASRDGTFAFEVRNTSTGSSANAVIIAQTLGGSDAYTRYTVPALSWTAGIDNSDADKYKVGVGSTVNLETWFEIAATGASRFFGTLDLQRTSDSTNFERVGIRWDSTTAKVGTSSGGTSPGRDLALEANSIERLRILASNGNVGLGTQAPASRLTVSGGDAEVTDSASGIILKSPDGTRWRVTISNLGILTTASITPP